MKSSAKKIELASVDDLFSTEEGRQDAKLEKIQEIPLSELHPFKNHPFKVKDDEAMMETADSIKQYGVLVPAIARPDPEGGYELVAGHRRHRASELAEKETMPVIVRDLDDDAATIIMVDSNLQRESLLPSERAFAYKMKLDAMKRQAGRPSKENVSQVGTQKRSDQLLAEQVGQSRNQIQRYIRLTELIPELMDMVDEKKIALNPAYELSFLKKEEQVDLLDAMDSEQATPSLSQAQRLKKYSQEGHLTLDMMRVIMGEEKKSDLDRVTFTSDTLRKYFPKSYTPQRMQETIIKLKRKITDLDRSKIEEQKKAVRAGYDMDIIPSDLATYGSEAKKLLQDLQSRNERMFLLTFLVLNTADNPRQLGNNIFQAGSIAQKYNCQLTRLDFQQEEGLMSCLPLGLNQIEIQRGLTTSSTAIFVPFTTQELFQNGKEALYYGINALSNNLIMVDRKLLKNPNGLILGTPGSGKSFSAKREIANCFLLTSDDVIICDPEAEYAPLVERLHGQVIKISPTSTNYINPMDLNLDYSDDESPLSLKSDFILSLCELIVGGKEGLQPVQKTIIDRCVRLVYNEYLNDPKPENMPILEDLYNLLREQEEKEAQYIATALEIYVTGSLNVFNHQSNVDIDNRIVCYDIKELGKQLKKIGMLVVQDQVWNRVTINRAAHKSTRYYIDEMHLLLKEEQTAAYTVEIWKRFRKWGGIPTGITQNVKVRPDRALCKAV